MTKTEAALRTCGPDAMCESLLSRLSDGKGFRDLHTMDLSQKVGEAKEQFLGVCYKTTPKDRGLMLNWCPFCGGTPGYFKPTRTPVNPALAQPTEPPPSADGDARKLTDRELDEIFQESRYYEGYGKRRHLVDAIIFAAQQKKNP